MSGCTHKSLMLLPEKTNRLRCRTCHLVISADELRGGFCPECHEVHGEKRYDFEEISAEGTEVTKYRCEECGAVIEWTEG